MESFTSWDEWASEMRFNKLLILEQSFLLIDYASSAMKNIYKFLDKALLFSRKRAFC